MNPDEPEHEELIRLLGRAIAEQNAMSMGKSNFDTTAQAIDAASEYARPLLKKEWERVKRGELAFRVARNWLAPLIVALSLMFLVFVWNGTFKM